MRILFLTWNYPPTVGGIESIAENLSLGLVARGHAVTVITARHPDADAAQDAAAGISRAPRSGLLGFALHAFRQGLRQVRRRNVDVILCTSFVAGLPGSLVAALSGRPFALLVHGSDLVVAGRIYQFLLRRVLSRAGVVVANSRHTHDLALARGARAESLVVIPPGLRLDMAEPSAAVLARWRGITAGRPTILTVGRLIKRKGVVEFVEQVMPELLRRVPTAQFLIVGDEASHSLIHHEQLGSRLRSAIASLGLQDAVKLLGRLPEEELQAVWRCTDLFVLPCLNLPHDVEGFGIVFQEAALVGVPSVGTRVGGIPDAIEDGVTGLVPEPEDYPAITEAVAGLLTDDARRRKMGAAARDRARANFAWPVIVERFEQELRRMC